MAPGAPGPPPTQVHSDAVQKALAPEPPSAAGAGRLGGAGGAGGAPGFGEDGGPEQSGAGQSVAAPLGASAGPGEGRGPPALSRTAQHQPRRPRPSLSPSAHGRCAVRACRPPPSGPIQVLHGPRPLSSLKCRFRFRSGEAQGRCSRLLTDLLASTRGPCPSVFLKGDQAVLPPWSSLLWVGQATGAAALRPACRPTSPHAGTCPQRVSAGASGPGSPAPLPACQTATVVTAPSSGHWRFLRLPPFLALLKNDVPNVSLCA